MEGLILIAVVIFLFGGTIKGLIGIGLPTAVISILSQFTDPKIAISLGFIPVILSNFWQIYRAGEIVATFRKFGYFAVTLSVVMWIVAGFAVQISAEVLTGAIGIGVVVFSLSSLVRKPPEIPDRYDRPAQIVFGVLGGIMGGLTAIWGPAMVIYFLARRIEKDEFVRGVGLLILAGVIPLMSQYVASGVMTRDIAVISAAMLVPTLIGFTIGEYIRKRLDAQRFQKAVLFMFLAMGLNLIRRALQ